MRSKSLYLGSMVFWGTFAVCSVPSWAQTPTGLTVKTATNKQVVLTWTGSASSYTVQRAALGGGYTTIATATTPTYTDTSIDAFTTYQYQVLNGTAASGSVTVGPPPFGVTNAAPAPLVGATPSTSYGYNISLTLDGNGDPAFVFIWSDPNGDNDASDTELLFRSWNRAQYKWNPVVKIATVGDVASTFRPVDSLAYDTSTGVFGAACEEHLPNDDEDILLYTSADGGVTWTLKNTFHIDATTLLGPSLALARGNLYLAYTLDPGDLNFVSGQLNQPPSTWTTKTPPAFQGLTNDWDAAPSVALDSTGNPGIAYMALDPNDDTKGPVLFWRPSSGTVVQITNSQGNGNGTAVKLAYYNLNPRATIWLIRNDPGNSNADGVHFVHSEDSGITWTTVLVPADGTSTTDYPFDMALTSKGAVAIAFGQNGNYGDASHKCGSPKLSLSTDLTNFTTCSPFAVSQNFSIYPAGLQVAYGGNDKLYLLWLESSGDPANTGILMYREPPAGAITGPTITSVSDNNVTRASIVAGSWISIFGANLSGTTRIWGSNDFNNGNALPITLDGVSVKVNGLPAAVYYISPTQINVQAPSPLSGQVSVQVTYNGAVSNTLTVNAVANAPTLFSYTVGGTTFPSALFANWSIIVGDPALAGNIVAKPKAGDYLQLYANALGSSPAGSIVNSVIPFASSLTVTIGGQTAPVQFAGLVAAGEYQINVMVPSLAPGLYPVIVTAAGQQSQSGVMVPVQ